MSRKSKKPSSPIPSSYASEALYQALFEQASDGIFIADAQGRYVEVNQSGCAMLGHTREEVLLCSMKDLIPDEDHTSDPLQFEELRSGKTVLKERRLRCKDGRLLPVEISSRMLNDGSFLGIVRDISQRKQVEQERAEHLRFLESMDLVNRAIQGAGDLTQMMHDVLDALLAIFGCDRAWLAYPCDPESLWWNVPMERSRPEFPGAFILGVELPMDADIIEICRILLAADGPVAFGPGTTNTLPPPKSPTSDNGVQSMLAMPVYPRSDKPYVFGLHQCSHPRVWTPQEQRLFQEIGRRLADALTSLLAYRNLRESERRLAEAERIAHIGWWDRDYTTMIGTLSDEACRIFGLPLEQHRYELNSWHAYWQGLIHPEDRANITHAMEAALQGGPRYNVEYRVVRADGAVRIVHSQGDVTWDETGRPRRMFGIMQDITELRQAENELRASEARFRTLVDHAADAFFLHDEPGFVLDVNRQACESLGYSREELIGMLPTEFDAGTDPSFINTLRAQLAAGEKVTFDTLHRRKDGSLFPVEVRTCSFWEGERRFGVSLVRDVTERKRVQQELTLFRSLIDHATDIIEVIDPVTGRFLDVNKQACLSHGYTREEYLTLTVPQINSVAAQRSWEDTMEELRRSGSFVRESRHRRKDGSSFPVEININYIRLDRDYVLAVVRDITDRQRADEALRASEERYRALYHENPSMLFTLDADGTIISVNDFGAGQLGYTKDELEHQSVLNSVYEDDRIAVGEQLHTCLQNPGLVYHWQLRKVRKNGSMMWVEEFARAIQPADGVLHVLIVCQDVTERKQLETKNEQLTAQFYQAQKMESIGRLAGGIAHDFNNLLVPIIGYIDLHLSDLPPDSKLSTDLAQVRKAADRAADLTRQILAFSRQQVLTLQMLDLNVVIDDFKEILQRLIGEDIALQTFLSSALYPVRADKGQIEQVLMNLAINSRDAMPAGGKLTIETVNAFLDQVYIEKYAADLTPGHYVMLAVSDTGQGMDAETRKRIFDPFFTTKESGKGTGLGLATVFGIIKQHRGHIWVYSEPGQGTTFKLYLPRTRDSRRIAPPAARESLSIYGTETVLVVEDEEMVRTLVCETLAAHGYNVLEAGTPAECLELAMHKEVVHLLLTDVIMPDMNGRELYQKLIALHPNSKVLYMSGYTKNVVARHSILDEGINFLQKPFTVRDLMRKVREALD